MDVFCVDDQPYFRCVMRKVIDATPGFSYVGEAASALAAIPVVRAVRPDLVLIDLRMPDMDGFDAASVLVEGSRHLVVAVMSAGPVEPPEGFAPRGGEVVYFRKEELCPRRLLDLWHGRRTR